MVLTYGTPRQADSPVTGDAESALTSQTPLSTGTVLRWQQASQVIPSKCDEAYRNLSVMDGR